MSLMIWHTESKTKPIPCLLLLDPSQKRKLKTQSFNDNNAIYELLDTDTS